MQHNALQSVDSIDIDQNDRLTTTVRFSHITFSNKLYRA